MPKTITINAIILSASVITMFLLIMIATISKREKLEPEKKETESSKDDDTAVAKSSLCFIYSLEARLSRVANIASFIGIFATVATIGITCLINIMSAKTPKIEVTVTCGEQWDWGELHEEDATDALPYGIDEYGHFTNFTGGYPDVWNFRVYNNGTGIAEDIVIKIEIGDVEFEPTSQPDEYNLENHLHGIGTYVTISRDLGMIEPDQYIDLPSFPSDNTMVVFKDDPVQEAVYDIKKNTILRLKVYSNEGLILEKIYNCKCVSVEDDIKSEYEIYQKEESKNIIDGYIAEYEAGHLAWPMGDRDNRRLAYAIDEILFGGVNDRFDSPYPDFSTCAELVNEHSEIPAEIYNVMYRTTLYKLNVYNEAMRQFHYREVTVYGRLFYLSKGYDDVDEMIRADMRAFAED